MAGAGLSLAEAEPMYTMVSSAAPQSTRKLFAVVVSSAGPPQVGALFGPIGMAAMALAGSRFAGFGSVDSPPLAEPPLVRPQGLQRVFVLSKLNCLLHVS